jgi:hypothetical protein
MEQSLAKIHFECSRIWSGHVLEFFIGPACITTFQFHGPDLAALEMGQRTCLNVTGTLLSFALPFTSLPCFEQHLGDSARGK